MIFHFQIDYANLLDFFAFCYPTGTIKYRSLRGYDTVRKNTRTRLWRLKHICEKEFEVWVDDITFKKGDGITARLIKEDGIYQLYVRETIIYMTHRQFPPGELSMSYDSDLGLGTFQAGWADKGFATYLLMSDPIEARKL